VTCNKDLLSSLKDVPRQYSTIIARGETHLIEGGSIVLAKLKYNEIKSIKNVLYMPYNHLKNHLFVGVILDARYVIKFLANVYMYTQY
jgi:hypothetical protein